MAEEIENFGLDTQEVLEIKKDVEQSDVQAEIDAVRAKADQEISQLAQSVDTFLARAEGEGEVGAEAAKEMRVLQREMVELRRSFFERLDAVVGITAKGKQHKWEAMLAAPESSRIWKEFKARATYLFEKFTQIRERATKQEKARRRKAKDPNYKSARVDDVDVFLPTEYIDQVVRLLQDYKRFDTDKEKSSQLTDLNWLASRVLGNLVQNKRGEEARRVYALSPNAQLAEAKAVLSVTKGEFPVNWVDFEAEKMALPPEKRGYLREDWHQLWKNFIYEKCAGQEDLIALVTVGKDSDYSTTWPVKDRYEALSALIGRPDRQNFLSIFSPIDHELQTIIEPPIRKRLFQAYLQSDLGAIAANFEFFKEDFEATSPKERAEVVKKISQTVASLYNGGKDPYSRKFDPDRDRYNGYDHYSPELFPFKILAQTKITAAERDMIVAALDPHPDHYRYGKKRQDLHWVKQRDWKRGEQNFLADLAADNPEALVKNGDVLLGISDASPAEGIGISSLIKQVIETHQSEVVYGFYVNLVYNTRDADVDLRKENLRSLVKYIIDENAAPGTALLAVTAKKLEAIDLGSELEAQIRIKILQGTELGGYQYGLGFDPLSRLLYKGKYGFESFSAAQKQFFIEKLLQDKDGYTYRNFVKYFPLLTPDQKGVFANAVYSIGRSESIIPLIEQFDEFPPFAASQLINFVLDSGKSEYLSRLFSTLERSQKVAQSLSPTTQAIAAYIADSGIADFIVLKKYIGLHGSQGREQANAYLEGLKHKAVGLVGSEINKKLRKDPEYSYLVRYAFPEGNYSDHEKNAACGDRLEHVKRYDFDRAGYPVELSGLLGFELRTTEEGVRLQDDQVLYKSYEQRIKKIRDFVGSRGPDNKALQKAFDEQVDSFFARYAASDFAGIRGLTVKEKMLILFISETLLRDKVADYTPNTDLLDLVVKYKYAYHENLEAYVQRSAHDVNQHRDATSQRFLLWQELSNIYGENVKHVLRHNIFEELAASSKNYDKIVDTFGVAVAQSSERFELGSRETKSIETLCKKIGDPVERYAAVADKLAELYGPQLKLKGSDEKKAEQQRQYDLESAAFKQKMRGVLGEPEDGLDAAKVGFLLSREYSVSPRQLARFENTFDNDQIPLVEIIVDGKPRESKYKVLLKQVRDMFGSNIKFKNDEDAEEFESTITNLLAPLENNLTKEGFFSLIPKLRTIRNQYRFGINAKLEELFALDLNAINREVAKFEEKIEVEHKQKRMNGPRETEVKKSAKKRKIRTYITKTQETANARMGAYLCIAGDEKMWQNPNYLEAVDVDEESGKCVGLTMYLAVPSADNKKYLWVGPNPFESFLTQVSAEKSLDHQYSVAVDFATRNGFEGIVVPPEDGQILGGCTNRGGNFPDLIKAKRLKNKNGELRVVDFDGRQQLGGSYGYEKGALIWQK